MIKCLSSKIVCNVLFAACVLSLQGCSMEMVVGEDSPVRASGDTTESTATQGSGSGATGSGSSPASFTLPCGEVVDTTDPVILSTPMDLARLTSQPDGHRYFKLGNDIDMSGVRFNPGSITTSLFDGAGFTISNLTVTSQALDNNGLFGTTTCTTIQNLTLSNSQVEFKDSNCSGTVVGLAEETSIDNVTLISAKVTGSGYWGTGGLIGCASGQTSVTHLNADVELNTLTSITGGIIGDTAIGASVIVADSTLSGSVNGMGCTGGIFGGVRGYGTSPSDLESSTAQVSNVNVQGSVTRGSIPNDPYPGPVGGVIGCNILALTTVTGVDVTGAVTGDGSRGGIIGWSYQPEPSLVPSLSGNSLPADLPPIADVDSVWL